VAVAGTRGNRIDRRCRGCWLRPSLCLCDEVPTVQTRTRVIVVRHQRERSKGSNTARLVAAALPNSELHDWGLKDQPVEIDPTDAWVLFPALEGAPPLQGVPKRLIVLDGAWSHTRRMIRRVPGVVGLPRLDVSAMYEDRVRMRRPPQPGLVSTLEAVSYALDMLEGPGTGDPLRALFELQTERMWHARGQPRRDSRPDD
jgi:DTW domain-containing protein YfiP